MPNLYTHLLSISVCAAGFLLLQRYRSSKVNRSFFSLLAFLYVFLFAVYLVSDHFTGNGVDQATIIQARFGLRGAAFGEYIWLITLTLGLLSAVIAMLGLFVFKGGGKKTTVSFRQCVFAYCLILAACFSNPASINLYNLPTGTLMPSRASSKSAVAEFYKYYQNPQLKSLSKEHKNIVFIYAESLERGFFDEETFPGLVERLKKIEKQSISFKNMHMGHGTGGTIWSISTSQCGLPLFLPNLAILNHGTGEFLPSATCLGDLLAKEGYSLTYYGGASLEFTGKGSFFKTHGFTEVLGQQGLLAKLEDKKYLSSWGVYDDSLLQISYDRFLELSEAKGRFGIFLLTLDTHSPGYPSKKCENIPYKSGENKHLNAVACSDYLLSDFINKIFDSPYASQTLIVLASDHINWNDAPSAELLKKVSDGRKNTFMIIEPGAANGREVTTKGTPIDIGTTILPFLGYSGQIGLGRDLLADSKKTEEEISYIQSRLYPWKTEILKFWGQPRIRKSLSVDIENRTIAIDKKSYKLPIFMELSDDLDTALLFGFNGSCEQHLKKMEPEKRFLMVGKCRFIKTSGEFVRDHGVAIANNGLCLITGKGQKFIFKKQLNEDVHYTIPELQGILDIHKTELAVHKNN